MTAAPDAIVRVARTALASEKSLLEQIYFQNQHHTSIVEFLEHHVNNRDRECGLLMQVYYIPQFYRVCNACALYAYLKDPCAWVLNTKLATSTRN